MQGEVYVYTGIKGRNMDAGIMTADVTGSSDSGIIDGQRPLGYNISWSLPGGITNGGTGQGGEWGYMLWRPDENPVAVTTQDLCLYLTRTLNVQFDENGNLIDESQTDSVQRTVNSLVWEYANRILDNAGLEGSDYSWDRFHGYFSSCISR